MENVLTITNLKQNILEFTAGLEGIDDNDMKVRLIIEANGMDLGFDAKRIKGTLWEVVIPALPMLEKTAYPFRMDVVSEGYFFDPLHGTVNVVGTHELYVTEPKNRSIPPKEIEALPNKHTAKPAGTTEVESSEDKVSPKVLKPTVDNKVVPKSDTAVADSMARLRAIASTETAEKATEIVIDAEKKVQPIKKSKPKKIEVNTAPKKVQEKDVKSKPVEDIIKKAKAVVKKALPSNEIEAVSDDNISVKKEQVTEKVNVAPTSSTFEEALEKVSKPIPKKSRAPKKVKAKPKASTIKKITEDKEIVAKPETEVKLESDNQDKVKDILSESDDDTKKVLTHPIKKKGKVTYH